MTEATEKNFQKEVLEESRNRPVLVDFWAEWCAPCRVLGPVLEKLEREYAGKFLLVKVNTETSPQLAQVFQIQSIPAVKLFRDGKMADEFVGALPEAKIREFLSRHVPDQNFLDAQTALEKGEPETALFKLEGATSSAALALIWQAGLQLLAVGNSEAAIKALERIPDLGTPYSLQKASLLEFLRSGASEESRKHFSLLFGDRAESALEYFLKSFEAAPAEQKEKARNEILAGFSVLGNENPLTLQYRRRLSSLMY